MKYEHIIYDIKHLLAALTDDTRISDAHLMYKIGNYWAIYLREDYAMTGEVDKSLYQRLPLIDVNSVGTGDDPELQVGTIKFGKLTLPSIMNFGEFTPIDMFVASKHERIYPIDRMMLMEMIRAKDFRLNTYKYYMYEGNTETYVYPYVNKVAVRAILDNPMDASIFQTTPVPLSSLVAGTEYTVASGSCTNTNVQSPVIYKKGDTFVAEAGGVYTGDAVVYQSQQIVDMGKDDDLPITREAAQWIALEILSKDFRLERENVFDTINDAADQLKSLRTE